MTRQGVSDFKGSETIPGNTRMVNTCDSTFVQTHRMNTTRSGP